MVSTKSQTNKSPKGKGGKDSAKPGRDVGDALRQAYDDTLGEQIPDDLLDLLKKLD